jgi:tRNA1Val (adenine37-N6)-methyltransferase
MSNTYFQFKQFRVDQENSSLKVCTEACLFGAYIPCESATRILDIGTGTGLLSLMVAQRSRADIHAIEIDEASCLDAKHNFESSNWKNRLHLMNDDAKQYSFETEAYDLIISNPPFFINQLKSSNSKTNQALHGTSLIPTDIISICKKALSEHGKLYILLPENEMLLFEQEGQKNGLYAFDRLEIYNAPGKPIFRVVQGFSYTQKSMHKNQLYIKENNLYSSNFTSLLQNYYLHF